PDEPVPAPTRGPAAAAPPRGAAGRATAGFLRVDRAAPAGGRAGRGPTPDDADPGHGPGRGIPAPLRLPVRLPPGGRGRRSALAAPRARGGDGLELAHPVLPERRRSLGRARGEHAP